MNLLFSAILLSALQVTYGFENPNGVAPSEKVANEECPIADSRFHYLTKKLREEKTGTDAGTLRLFYYTQKNFDPRKPTIVVIPGGPGEYLDPNEDLQWGLEDEANIVIFHHRGLGCTKVMSQSSVMPYEPGLFSMERSAEDIDAIRQELLGNEGNWYVYGVSYGSILAQVYALKFPAHVQGLMLDSTTFDSKYLTLARSKYLALVTAATPTVNQLFGAVFKKFPLEKTAILRRVFAMQYDYHLMTDGVTSLLKDILGATDLETAKKLYAVPPIIPMGMTRSIFCEELWDYAPRSEADDYWLWYLSEDCPRFFKTFRKALELGEPLKKLDVPTVILGGTRDHVLPIEGMRALEKILPRAVLMENHFSGHGLFHKKLACGRKLFLTLIDGFDKSKLTAIAKSPLCQDPPATTRSRDLPRLEWGL